VTVVLAIGDLHCGSEIGITPPDWQADDHAAQMELWRFAKEAARVKPDIIICNGDAIHGKNMKSGCRQLITTDREEQVDMAEATLRMLSGGRRGVKFILTAGTEYHVGHEEDWEHVLASRLGGSFGGHEYLSIAGVTFDIKHHLGSSSVPHGRHTAIARDHLWSILWNEHSDHPKSDVILRSHVHYHSGAFGPGWLAMSLPAFCGLGDHYGVRRCSGTVDFGWAVFNCNKGAYTWHVETKQLAQAAPRVRKL
jgi:hypothetical protein